MSLRSPGISFRTSAGENIGKLASMADSKPVSSQCLKTADKASSAYVCVPIVSMRS